MDIVTLLDRCADEDACRKHLEALRWPSGVACTRCGDMDVSPIKGRGQWHCIGCGYHFSVKSGTIMHDSHLPLRKWFAAIYLLCQSKKGMSAHQLHRTIGVAYRTAWYLCHRIREAMGNDPLTGPTLVGVIEVDETMIGGKRKGDDWRANKHWHGRGHERGGRVRIERIPDVRHTLHDFSSAPSETKPKRSTPTTSRDRDR